VLRAVLLDNLGLDAQKDADVDITLRSYRCAIIHAITLTVL
jgi:hypothetical protein